MIKQYDFLLKMIAAYGFLKNLHFNVQSEAGNELHEFLGDIADNVNEYADEFCESYVLHSRICAFDANVAKTKVRYSTDCNAKIAQMTNEYLSNTGNEVILAMITLKSLLDAIDNIQWDFHEKLKGWDDIVSRFQFDAMKKLYLLSTYSSSINAVTQPQAPQELEIITVVPQLLN